MTTFLRTTAILLILTSMWFSTSWAVSNSYESSAEYLYKFSEIQYLPSLLFGFFFFLCTYLKVKLKPGLLLFVFILWLTAGRYFYLKEFSSCSIGTSVYFFQDNRFDLCGQTNQDYETAMSNVIYEQLPFWRLKFTLGFNEKVIFIGPFAWNSTLQIIDNSSMKSK